MIKNYHGHLSYVPESQLHRLSYYANLQFVIKIRRMNDKHLLINSITLLYRESKLPALGDRSTTLVRNILTTIKLPETALTFNPEAEQLAGLKQFALAMASDPQDHEYEINELLQRSKMIAGEDLTLYEILKEVFTTELNETGLKRNVTNLRRTLQNHFREEKIKDIIHKAGVQIKFNRETIVDMRQYVAELCAALEPYQQDVVTKDPAIVTTVNFNNKESLSTVFEDVRKQANGSSILRTGWQGINRMLRGGFRRGEEVLISALQHNFKTGFTLSLFKHFALYNVPEMIDPTKKPLLVRISFEDDLASNMRFLYSSLKENETGLAVTDEEFDKMTSDEISEYVMEKMKVNGYHIEMIRVDPSQWSYIHICNKLLEYEADGYEVHVLMLDYLFLVPTTGCSQGPHGHDVRDLFRRMRNFTNPRKITLITPHQLSTDAKQLIRDNHSDFVKLIANKGYYAGSKQIDQEVDLEIYIHIEKVNGKSWLTCQRGKHRLPGITPEEDKYTVLPFEDIGTIRDDVNGADTSRRRPGGGPVGGNESLTPWWEHETQV